MIDRRRFLQSSSLLALAPLVPAFVARTAQAASAEKDRRVLVIVQLDGGNDALNTIVPFADPTYEKLRPKLKIDKKNVLRLSETLGLHPSLKPLDPLLQAGHLAVVPGVGYPNPNRSHFESMAIWHTARFDPDERKGYGWVGRALDVKAASAYVVGSGVPGALRGRRSSAVSLNRIEDLLLTDVAPAQRAVGPATEDDLLAFVRRETVDAHAAADRLAQMTGGAEGERYPGAGLAERLKLVARLLKTGLSARVYYTTQAGYDTHATQSVRHAQLLSELASAVAAFSKDLNAAGFADRVTLLAFSEFGRTIKENGSAGTDHGTAGAVFLAGPGVRGGIAGLMPSLTELVQGEPRMTTDFRAVYTTVLEDWLGIAAPEVVGGRFTNLPLIRA